MATSPTGVQAQSERLPERAAPSSTTSYDAATEGDALIRAHIEVDAPTGEVVFRGTLYPVWSVVLNLRGSGYDWKRVQRMFPELSLDALHAAQRFWDIHADDIREYVER